MGNCFGTSAKSVNPVLNSNNTDASKPRSKEFSLGSFVGSPFNNSADISRHDSANGGSLRSFTYGEMRAATLNFRNNGKLGEGGFGVVFKGYLDEQTLLPVKPGHGMAVAIKKLNLEGMQGHQEWVTEVNLLGALHHPNVVKLIGFCAEDSNRLLVYEYMSRGSLEYHLFRQGNYIQGLPWDVRMKVAVGAARGLAFLHDAQICVIYRDFKAANILLDDNYNAKLSDFGLAKEGPTGDDTHVTTRVLGTYGYAAPEYLATGHLTPRSDVYSFGVVLLELLTGRRAMDVDRPHGEQKVVDWAKPYLGSSKKRAVRILDSRLNGQYSLKGAYTVVNLALQCLNEDARARPSMKEVVESLEPLLSSCP
eukprot:c12539_g1_i1 orf=146-1240(+)